MRVFFVFCINSVPPNAGQESSEFYKIIKPENKQRRI